MENQTTNLLLKHYELILIHLYRFRFLNRLQIQTLLHHKYFNRIIIWLNYLADQNYVKRDYNPKTPTVGAIYSLGLKGRKYLKEKKLKEINSGLLDRVWRESKSTEVFKKHCLQAADVYISITKLVQTTGAKLFFKSKVELTGMQYLIVPEPDAFFSITEKTGGKRGYFLDVFDPYPPRVKLWKRVDQYFNYYNENYWQDHSQDPFPNIIFIASDDWAKGYLYRQIQKHLEEEPDLSFYLAVRDTIKAKGLTRDTIHKVELKDQ